jgi:hypothetical protein
MSMKWMMGGPNHILQHVPSVNPTQNPTTQPTPFGVMEVFDISYNLQLMFRLD